MNYYVTPTQDSGFALYQFGSEVVTLQSVGGALQLETIMSTFTFKIHGRNVKFKAATTTQALFARDHHLAHLRNKAKARAAAKRLELAAKKEASSSQTLAFWRGVRRGMDNHAILAS